MREQVAALDGENVMDTKRFGTGIASVSVLAALAMAAPVIHADDASNRLYPRSLCWQVDCYECLGSHRTERGVRDIDNPLHPAHYAAFPTVGKFLATVIRQSAPVDIGNPLYPGRYTLYPGNGAVKASLDK